MYTQSLFIVFLTTVAQGGRVQRIHGDVQAAPSQHAGVALRNGLAIDQLRNPEASDALAGARRDVNWAWQRAQAIMKANKRVTKDAFIQVCKEHAKSQKHLTDDNTANFEIYLHSLFDTAIAMMSAVTWSSVPWSIPGARGADPVGFNSLGKHCFGYAFLLAEAFYFAGPNSGADPLGLASKNELVGEWNDLAKKWKLVGEWNGRINKKIFKAQMKEKYSSQWPLYVADSGIGDPVKMQRYSEFLDLVFDSGIQMMRGAYNDEAHLTTLGKHCYAYADLMAAEFYFDGKSGADNLKIK